MSQENVDAWQRAVDAYNRGDTEGAVEIYDPDVEWQPAVQRLLGGVTAVYHGRLGVREFLQDLDEAFAEIRIEIADARDLGDFRNGKVTRVVSFLDHREALEAAGLSE